MSRFLLTTFGSAGDVFPMLGLAVELRRRGHLVTLLTNAHFQRVADRYGIPFLPLGTEAEFFEVADNPDLWDGRRGFQTVFRSLEPYVQEQYRVIEGWAAESENPEAPGTVLANCLSLGALMAQEVLGIPCLTVHLQPAVLWSDHAPPSLPGLMGPRWLKRWLFRLGERWFIDPVALPMLQAWRREKGLSPIRHLMEWWNSPTGVLCLFPEWFAPRQPDWPRPLVQTDFPLWNPGSEGPLPTDLEAFLENGEAPIVFTPGSANRHGKKFFGEALRACQQLSRRGIFLSQFPEHLPPRLPDTMLHVSFVPLDRLLPRAAAFVHHGGIGSTSQALLAGTPQLLAPLAHDQFDNAARLRRLRVGDSLPASRLTAPRLVRKLKRIIDDPGQVERGQTLATNMVAERGLVQAADWLERWQGDGRRFPPRA